MKKEKLLIDLMGKSGTLLCSYSPKINTFYKGIDDIPAKDMMTSEETENLKAKYFTKVGYFFVFDSITGEALALTAIGDQWNKYGFNDRINRIRRKATKQNTSIYNNHDRIDIYLVEPSNIKNITDNESVWNFLKGTKKTERNTILENARLIKKAYSFKY